MYHGFVFRRVVCTGTVNEPSTGNERVDDIAQALRCEVVATLSDEGSAMRSAQDQGVLLGDLAGKNGFSKGIKGLAHLLSGEDR